MNVSTMKTDELKELLKNRGQPHGNRNVPRNELLGALREHGQKPVDFEKLTEVGARAELKVFGKVVAPKLKVGELRELVKQAAKEAQQAAEQAAEQAAKEAQQAAEQAAEQAAKEAQQAAEQEAAEQEAAEQEPQAEKAERKKKRKHGESVEAALTPVKINPKDVKRYKGSPKKATSIQKFKSNHATFTAQVFRLKTIGAKKAGKKQRLELGQNAYLLRPGLNQIIEVGFSVCVADVEEKNMTWIALAHVMSTAANRQVHPGMKEAAKNAWTPSTTIAEQEQRDAVDAAYNEGAQQHLQQQQDGSDSDV